VTIEPIMPYTNIDTFREKEARNFSKISKKVWESLNFIDLIFKELKIPISIDFSESFYF
jgi:hypothetical protein